MDFNIYALKQVNNIFKQMKNIKQNEVKYETFAGKPIKLAKSRH